MASLCTVCQKSKVPNYFLIKCISCAKAWHHRCHSPPIPDPELVAIIRGFNAARTLNSRAVLNWKCGACRKPKQRAPAPRTNDPIVVHDDDDEVQIIEPPPSRQESLRHSTSAQPVRIIDDPIDFHSPSTTSTLSLGLSDNHVPNSDHDTKRPPISLSTNPGHHASTPSQPRSKTPEESISPSFEAWPRSADGPSPAMPPALEPPLNNQVTSSVSPGLEERPFLERWSMATVHPPRSDQTPPANPKSTDLSRKTPLFHPALLPHYINSRFRSFTTESDSDKKSDVWHLTALRKTIVKDVGTGPSSNSSSSYHPHRSRKNSKPVHYHDLAHPRNPNVSKVPFYFSVNTWMKENEDALASFEAIATNMLA